MGAWGLCVLSGPTLRTAVPRLAMCSSWSRVKPASGGGRQCTQLRADRLSCSCRKRRVVAAAALGGQQAVPPSPTDAAAPLDDGNGGGHSAAGPHHRLHFQRRCQILRVGHACGQAAGGHAWWEAADEGCAPLSPDLDRAPWLMMVLSSATTA